VVLDRSLVAYDGYVGGPGGAGATDFVAAPFPADGDAAASLARTRALLKDLVRKT
jgi:hypothetical protein